MAIQWLQQLLSTKLVAGWILTHDKHSFSYSSIYRGLAVDPPT